MAHRYIYKLAHQHLVEQLDHDGQSLGSEHDIRDGFIHFSTASQCLRTFAKYFESDLQAGQVIWLLAVDIGHLAESALIFEPPKPIGGAPSQSVDDVRAAQLFPHLYGPLHEEAIVHRLQLKLPDVDQQITEWIRVLDPSAFAAT